MTQNNIIELAKQGDTTAIATLLNRHLQPKGITVKANIKDNCLQIILESSQIPDQETWVSYIHKGLITLKIASIEKVKIYGCLVDEDFPAWNQEFELITNKQAESNSPLKQTPIINDHTNIKQLSVRELAKQGDIKAITKLLNLALQYQNITAKAKIKDNKFDLMLDGIQIPDEETAIGIVRAELLNLNLPSIETVTVYGRKVGEEFPTWNKKFSLLILPTQEIELTANQKKPLQTKQVLLNSTSIPPDVYSQNLSITVNGTTVNLDKIDFFLKGKFLGILGSIILFIGVFTPLVSVPVLGTINYIHNGRIDGVILLLLAVASLMLTITNKYKFLWWTGIASFAVMAIGIINFQFKFFEIKQQLEAQLINNNFEGLADAAINSVQFQWGWVVLFIGVCLIISTAFIEERANIKNVGYFKYFTRLFDTNKSKYFYLGIVIILLIVIIPMIKERNNQIEDQKQAVKSKESEAKVYISSLNKAQQAFYIQELKFASTLSELEMRIPSETKSYQYSILVADNSQVITTATAKEEELKSYAGAVFPIVSERGEKITITAVCQSNKPSKVAPITPQLLLDNEIQCPSGSSKIDK